MNIVIIRDNQIFTPEVTTFMSHHLNHIFTAYQLWVNNYENRQELVIV